MQTFDDNIDQGRTADWSQTSQDYAKHRPGPPDAFYERLALDGIGLPGQDILDIGTGTGHLARRFAESGVRVLGTDLATEQIEMARSLCRDHARFEVAPSQTQPVADASQDVVTASQCWLYFPQPDTLNEVARVLRPRGALVICHFSFLPREDAIAAASEAVVLRHNPDWTGADWDGVPDPMTTLDPRFDLRSFFWFDEDVPFTAESWRGRMRALRGIAAALSPTEVAAFDRDHAAMLKELAGDRFTVRHRVDARIFRMR